MSGIGVLNEKPLHASIKQWYAQPGDRFEVAVDRFVVDIVRDGLLIEIQTRNFSSIKSKLANLVQSHHVRLIYPIIGEKWIIQPATDDHGRIARRKSPRKGRFEDLFREMVSLAPLMSHRNFSLEVLLIRVEESRRYEVRRRRRGRWVIEARRLLDVLDQRVFTTAADWRGFVPEGLESFTTSDLATATRLRRDLAQKMAYCLHKGSLIDLIGRQGRANLYRVPRHREGSVGGIHGEIETGGADDEAEDRGQTSGRDSKATTGQAGRDETHGAQRRTKGRCVS